MIITKRTKMVYVIFVAVVFTLTGTGAPKGGLIFSAAGDRRDPVPMGEAAAGARN
jgi:hypothetical protein